MVQILTLSLGYVFGGRIRNAICSAKPQPIFINDLYYSAIAFQILLNRCNGSVILCQNVNSLFAFIIFLWVLN